ncbi:MAG: cytochrome c biogenesis heme-transporting ATPase CcmA [Pseudohongiellaceae bacterium]|nr:heme ABC transporter ATP-binding protein CcmA [Gammaproteobacteria bacterium]
MAHELENREVLKAEQLFCERDDRVLFRELSFSARAGEVIQIKGSNGSGKTTLLRVICGLNDNYHGTLKWFNEPIEDNQDDFYSSLIYLGHQVGVNKVLTPVENLRWSVGLRENVTSESIYQALAEIGLRGFEDSQCFSLSAGQQQRVSLSKLLLGTAIIWILDEPFTTLDVDGVQLLEKLLGDHARKGGVALVTTHHELSLPDLKILELG